MTLSILIVEGANIFLSNSLAGSSMEVSAVKKQIQDLDEKNTTLRTELLSFSSFENIASRAAGLGFGEYKDTAIMINTPLKVAINR